MLSPERSQLSHQSHLEILEGYRERAAQQAEEAMYQHIERIDREVHNLSSKRVRATTQPVPPPQDSSFADTMTCILRRSEGSFGHRSCL